MLKILIILILIIIISLLRNKNNEDFTSIEAIQNISTLYNKQKLTSTNLEILNDASFNNININGELRIKNKYIINTDNLGNLEVYDISNNIKNRKLWGSSDFLNSKTKGIILKGIKLLEPLLCDASGRYCIIPRRYINYNKNWGADDYPQYGLNPDGHMEFISYDTDKKGNGSFDEWDILPKNIYLTQGFSAGFKAQYLSSVNWDQRDATAQTKQIHKTWKTTDGDTIPTVFFHPSMSSETVWNKMGMGTRVGKQIQTTQVNPEFTGYASPFKNDGPVDTWRIPVNN